MEFEKMLEELFLEVELDKIEEVELIEITEETIEELANLD